MEQARTVNVAILGGGPGCKAIMDMIFAESLKQLRMKLMGVASTNPEAEGYLYAKEKGVFTTSDYRDLYKLKDLHMIIELTGRDELANEVSRTKPDHVRLMDHVAARLFWDVFQGEEERIAERERSSDALRESEEKYSTLVENSLTGIYMDQGGRIVFANNRFAEIYRYSKDELIGMETWRLVHPDDRPLTDEIRAKRLKREEAPSEYEARGLTKDGEAVWIARRNTQIEYQGKEAILGNVVDITESKRAEERRRDSQERYRTVLEASPDPVVVYDMEGKGTYINPAFTRVFGWTPGEVFGKKMDYVPDENWPETEAMIGKVQAGEGFSGIESRRYTKKGNILDVSISAAIHLNRDGVPVGSIHILRDITEQKRVAKELRKAHDELEIRVQERTAELTNANILLEGEIAERKRAEEQILESKTMLQAVFDGISDPLIMLDKDLTVRMLNMPAVKYYQVDARDVMGKLCHQGLRGNSDPCEGCDIVSAVWSGRPVTFERKGFMDSDRLEEVVIYPIKEAHSEVGSAIIRISDITEARFMERQLIRSEKLASLGLLLSAIVHEINNPLAIINEKTGLMQDVLEFSSEFEHREKFLDLSKSILSSVDRAKVIIRRLLGFVRRADIKTETIDLNRLLEEVLEFLEKEAFYRRINVSLDFSPELPTLESDKGQLQQVFLNITKNAFEVVDDGGNVSIVTRPKDSDTLQVVITDDGCGMTPEQVEHIFQPFFTSGKESGTGLGLYITHEIVSKNLGGSITVESEQGKGTTFTVELYRGISGAD